MRTWRSPEPTTLLRDFPWCVWFSILKHLWMEMLPVRIFYSRPLLLGHSVYVAVFCCYCVFVLLVGFLGLAALVSHLCSSLFHMPLGYLMNYHTRGLNLIKKLVWTLGESSQRASHYREDVPRVWNLKAFESIMDGNVACHNPLTHKWNCQWEVFIAGK